MMKLKFEWFSVDNEIQFNLNKSKLKKYGWVNSDGTPVPINYHINKESFRHDGTHSEYIDGGIMYVGDSDVFGVGNSLQNTFTYKAHYMSKLADMSYYNFGIPSRGIETYYRTIKKYITKLILMLLYYFHRGKIVAVKFGIQIKMIFLIFILIQSFINKIYHMRI